MWAYSFNNIWRDIFYSLVLWGYWKYILWYIRKMKGLPIKRQDKHLCLFILGQGLEKSHLGSPQKTAAETSAWNNKSFLNTHAHWNMKINPLWVHQSFVFLCLSIAVCMQTQCSEMRLAKNQVRTVVFRSAAVLDSILVPVIVIPLFFWDIYSRIIFTLQSFSGYCREALSSVLVEYLQCWKLNLCYYIFFLIYEWEEALLLILLLVAG